MASAGEADETDLNHKHLKKRAKASCDATFSYPALVSLVYLLLTIGIMVVAMFACGQIPDPEQIVSDIENGQWVYWFRMEDTPPVYYVVMAIVAVFALLMSIGYMDYTLRIARGQENGFQTLLTGFNRISKSLLLILWLFIKYFLWALLFYGIAIAVGTVLFNFAGVTTATVTVYVLLLIAATVPYIMRVLYYEFAIFVYLDDPSIGARGAVAKSKTLMKGRRMDYFILMLSFIGWIILNGLTFSGLFVVYGPYMYSTKAHYYDELVQAEQVRMPYHLPEPF